MIPIVALMLIVLTGFAALTLDAGVSYDQARNDQDVADSAALAASYWLYSNQSGTLQGAYNAAQNIKAMDCVGPSSPCTVVLNFYGSSWTRSAPGTPVCAPTSSTSACLSGAASNTSYVGATVINTSNDYFANLQSSNRTHTIMTQAVAQVFGSGGSSAPDYSPQGACEICVFGNVTTSGSGNTLEADGGSIDIGGYLFLNNAHDTVTTTNGYGIDIIGASQQNGATVYIPGSYGLLDSSGELGIDGGSGYAVFFNSSWNTVEAPTLADLNLSSSTQSPPYKNNSRHNSISPGYGTATTPSFSDPLASLTTPTSGTASAPTYTGMTDYGTWTYPSSPSCPTSETLFPGIYTTIQDTSCANVTINFEPGLYVLDGSAAEQGIFVNSNGVTFKSPDGAVTFYLTCNSGGATPTPAYCGTLNTTSPWDAGTATCSTTSAGAQLYNNAPATLDLTGATVGGEQILFYADRCNSSNVMMVNSSGLTADSGFPAGALYAHSGTIYLNAPTSALPAPMLVGNIYFNSASSTLGTASGSIPLGSTPSTPGDLVQ